jgi:hypothetical protein
MPFVEQLLYSPDIGPHRGSESVVQVFPHLLHKIRGELACVVGNSYVCTCFIRSVQFGLFLVNQKVFVIKVFIVPVHSVPMGFGCDLCHALAEFSDLLSLTFCCVALMY